MNWRDEADEQEKRHLYYASREWGLLREAVRKRAGGLCESCKARPIYAVHHLTYIRLYCERLEDLQGLCNDCHKGKHGLDEAVEAATPQPEPEAKEPPEAAHNIEAQEAFDAVRESLSLPLVEAEVLAFLVWDPGRILPVSVSLDKGDEFSCPINQALFNAILALDTCNAPIFRESIWFAIKTLVPDYHQKRAIYDSAVERCLFGPKLNESLDDCVEVVSSLALRRRMVWAARDVIMAACDPTMPTSRLIQRVPALFASWLHPDHIGTATGAMVDGAIQSAALLDISHSGRAKRAADLSVVIEVMLQETCEHQAEPNTSDSPKESVA